MHPLVIPFSKRVENYSIINSHSRWNFGCIGLAYPVKYDQYQAIENAGIIVMGSLLAI